MYNNLLLEMKKKNITYTQISILLDCGVNTVSDRANGVRRRSFSVDDAFKIRRVLFPEYDLEYLFKREESWNMYKQ